MRRFAKIRAAQRGARVGPGGARLGAHPVGGGVVPQAAGHRPLRTHRARPTRG